MRLFLKLKFPRFFSARQNSNFTEKSLFLRQRDRKKFYYFFAVVPSPFGSILTAIKGILYQEIWHLNVVLSPHTKNSQKTGFLVLLVKVTVIFFKCKKPSFRFPLYRTQNRKGRTKEKFNNKCFWLASSFPAKIAPHFFFKRPSLTNFDLFCQICKFSASFNSSWAAKDTFFKKNMGYCNSKMDLLEEKILRVVKMLGKD